ncbi:molybdenum cofactor guanylyltransferase [Silvibacterium dinghuense]|uniref:Probable molybdenum cofactor guanylyltransferase n=1 Tax=Silvibacterium dinghuense TaxID=1560006 RepID=A0A4Q1SG58_9BACT|nr:molybdenum cofactor guanylyltransferase [Silvibacterium dinghuense]RXS96528.1 molybdenum cofactor guanylyltransferase [Silvibacterium dinghuense]GGG91551.1 molybdenum cofactor guanylyltransferase [Silvibacterium dinghuense]
MRGFVLAGGQSRRMGQDKALLPWQGRALIEHSLAKFEAMGISAQILGSRPDLAAFAPIIPDRFPGHGPLGGIESALAGTDAELNLFLAVDVPCVPVDFLKWLVERAEMTRAGATIPSAGGRLHPLCAVYHRGLHPYLRTALEAGDAKVQHVIPQAAASAGLRVDDFDIESIAATGAWLETAGKVPLHRWLENWNTPQQFAHGTAGLSGRSLAGSSSAAASSPRG